MADELEKQQNTDLTTAFDEIQGVAERPKSFDSSDMSGTEDIALNEVRLPRLAIAQGLSPQLVPDEGSYIKGLVIGDMFNDVTGEVYGRGPLTLVPVLRHVTRIEFDPLNKGVPLDRNVPANDPRMMWIDNKPPRATEYVEFASLLLRKGKKPEKLIVSIKTTNKYQKKAAELWTTLVVNREGAIYTGMYNLSSKMEKGKNKEGQELFGTRITGVTANMGEIEDKTIAEGRFVLDHEVERAAAVCVIGMDVREKFFPGVDPIGKELKIAEMPMRIVGVEEKRGSMLGMSLDNLAYIPLSTFERLFGRRRSLELHGKSINREEFQAAFEQARVSMRNHHKLKGDDEDDFGMVNVEQVNNQVDQFTGAIASVVIPITFISLVVGGIVVMNMMLFSVTERTAEIGLRKALGARRKQILVQFLIESSVLTSLGGVLGLGLAAGLAWLIGATTAVPMTITITYVILSVGFSAAIGMIFGIYPAYKAARLDPIKALTKI